MSAPCNISIPSYNCTLQTCCLAQSDFLYLPSYSGNLFFLIFFAVAILPQLWLAVSHRTWGFTVGIILGLLGEVIGYAGRVMLHDNPFNGNAFLLYLICVTVAPVFISAAIYLSLSRIVVIYGEHISPLRPRTIALIFMTSDFTSLVLQSAGGGITDTADVKSEKQAGIDVMIAGLFLQAISLAAFLAYMMFFLSRCSKGVLNSSAAAMTCRNALVFKVFLCNLILAVLAILTRSIFRVAELWQGFAGKLWNDETDFLVLDGAMIAIAVLLLTLSHPGIAFRGQWRESNWSFKGKSPSKA